MFAKDVKNALSNVEKISHLSEPFCRAEREDNRSEAERLSEDAGNAIKSVVIDLRGMQDSGRSPKDTQSVGLWIKKSTEEQRVQAIASRGISAGEPLSLREALNKFAHVTQATFAVDPEHRMILMGNFVADKWIVDISIADFCEAARDALRRTS